MITSAEECKSRQKLVESTAVSNSKAHEIIYDHKTLRRRQSGCVREHSRAVVFPSRCVRSRSPLMTHALAQVETVAPNRGCTPK